MEADLAQATGRTLMEQELVVAGLQLDAGYRKVLGIMQIGGHELENQRQVHRDGAFELGQSGHVNARGGRVALGLERLRRHHVGQQRQHLLGLRGGLHLGDGVEQQVAAIVGACGTEVVHCALAEELHRQQAGIRVDEFAAHMVEFGHRIAVQNPVVGVGD
ncbi:Uncharacterised protein [Mycobacteroides abscessus subsp. abscessus]|nr:Uncharacterised protein [Mycobacteroides abscessus subsp. abscessus]